MAGFYHQAIPRAMESNGIEHISSHPQRCLVPRIDELRLIRRNEDRGRTVWLLHLDFDLLLLLGLDIYVRVTDSPPLGSLNLDELGPLAGSSLDLLCALSLYIDHNFRVDFGRPCLRADLDLRGLRAHNDTTRFGTDNGH